MTDTSFEAESIKQQVIINHVRETKKRLKEVLLLDPPEGIEDLHHCYINAFSSALKARQLEFAGSDSQASDEYQKAADEFDKTVKMWKALGVTS